MLHPRARACRHLTHSIRPPHSQVSEDQVRQVFSACGAIVDTRMCGDPNSALRFAFIEFETEEAVGKARAELRVAGKQQPRRLRRPC